MRRLPCFGLNRFAIGISALRCGDAYLLTDVWDCTRIDDPDTDLEAHARSAYDAFLAEPAENDGPDIRQSEFVFIRF